MYTIPPSTAELRQQLATQASDEQRMNFASKLQAAIEYTAHETMPRAEAIVLPAIRRHEAAGHLAEIISISEAPSYAAALKPERLTTELQQAQH